MTFWHAYLGIEGGGEAAAGDMAYLPPFRPTDFHQLKAGSYAKLRLYHGSEFTLPVLAFDDTTDESATVVFYLPDYTSGNLTLTLLWLADSASSGAVVWNASIANITPNTDTTSATSKTFATASASTDTHLGTTVRRVHSIDINIGNLDSIAAGDLSVLEVTRNASGGGDTLSGDALLALAVLTYTNT